MKVLCRSASRCHACVCVYADCTVHTALVLAAKVMCCIQCSLVYYYNSHRQPRVRHEKPWRRFELSECFLEKLEQKLSTFTTTIRTGNEKLLPTLEQKTEFIYGCFFGTQCIIQRQCKNRRQIMLMLCR